MAEQVRIESVARGEGKVTVTLELDINEFWEDQRIPSLEEFCKGRGIEINEVKVNDVGEGDGVIRDSKQSSTVNSIPSMTVNASRGSSWPRTARTATHFCCWKNSAPTVTRITSTTIISVWYFG